MYRDSALLASLRHEPAGLRSREVRRPSGRRAIEEAQRDVAELAGRFELRVVAALEPMHLHVGDGVPGRQRSSSSA